MRVGELRVPALAGRAGVSVPTVNRHFPTRQALLEALVDRFDGETRGKVVPPEAFFGTSLPESVRLFFAHMKRFEVLDADVANSAVVWETRARVTIPRRRAFVSAALEAAVPGVPEPHRTWAVDMFVMLLSSANARAMGRYLELDADEAAARVTWTIELILAECRRRAG